MRETINHAQGYGAVIVAVSVVAQSDGVVAAWLVGRRQRGLPRHLEQHSEGATPYRVNHLRHLDVRQVMAHALVVLQGVQARRGQDLRPELLRDRLLRDGGATAALAEATDVAGAAGRCATIRAAAISPAATMQAATMFDRLRRETRRPSASLLLALRLSAGLFCGLTPEFSRDHRLHPSRD